MMAKKETEYEHLMQVQNLLIAEKSYLNIPLSKNEQAMVNETNNLSDTDDSKHSDTDEMNSSNVFKTRKSAQLYTEKDNPLRNNYNPSYIILPTNTASISNYQFYSL